MLSKNTLFSHSHVSLFCKEKNNNKNKNMSSHQLQDLYSPAPLNNICTLS
jgi:hypothetical protein